MVSPQVKIFFDNIKADTLFEDIEYISELYNKLTPHIIYDIFKPYGVNPIMREDGRLDDIDICSHKINNYFYYKDTTRYNKLKKWYISMIINHMMKYGIFFYKANKTNKSNESITLSYRDLLVDNDYDTNTKYDRWIREYTIFLSQLEITVSQINYTNKIVDIYINNINSNCDSYITELEDDIIKLIQNSDSKINKITNMFWILFIVMVIMIFTNVYRKG